ncbi:hypothetical protein V6N13_004754 [Hibiscus sabdariffa]
MNIKLFVLNAQVCGHRNFLRVTRKYLRDYHLDVCVFLEPRISHAKADQITAALGFPNSFRVEAIEFSGDIWVCWLDHISISIKSYHFQFIHCSVSNGFDSFMATFIHASLSHGLRGDLWHHLRALASTMTQPWAIIGNFNATLLHQDRQGCSSNNPDRDFQNMVFDCSLYDLDSIGLDFT